MLDHVRFCLDEIECEIESHSVVGLSIVEQAELHEHIAGMRTVLEQSEFRRRRPKRTSRSDDLSLIRGIDAAMATKLRALGFSRYSEIAALMPGDNQNLMAAGIDCEQISTDNWIEQAAILATGKRTHYAAALQTSAPTGENRIQWPATPVPPPAPSDSLARLVDRPANDATAEEAKPRPWFTGVRNATAALLAALLAGIHSGNFMGLGH
ncbi:MAG: hypothetical protein ACK5JT_07060 [Hyphomicrobiaceae bacterium]